MSELEFTNVDREFFRRGEEIEDAPAAPVEDFSDLDDGQERASLARSFMDQLRQMREASKTPRPEKLAEGTQGPERSIETDRIARIRRFRRPSNKVFAFVGGLGALAVIALLIPSSGSQAGANVLAAASVEEPAPARSSSSPLILSEARAEPGRSRRTAPARSSSSPLILSEAQAEPGRSRRTAPARSSSSPLILSEAQAEPGRSRRTAPVPAHPERSPGAARAESKGPARSSHRPPILSEAQAEPGRSRRTAAAPAPTHHHRAVKRAVHRHHANGAALYTRGLAAFNQGNMSRARHEFRASAHAGHVPAYRALGVVYRKQGKRAAAIRAFKTYVHKAPHSRDAKLVRKLVAQLERGRR